MKIASILAAVVALSATAPISTPSRTVEAFRDFTAIGALTVLMGIVLWKTIPDQTRRFSESIDKMNNSIHELTNAVNEMRTHCSKRGNE
jgi:HAMP domain-containing protein